MKKGLAVILCLLMAVSCLLLQACGDTGKKDLSESRFVGTWKAVSVSIKDVEEPFEKECYLVLNADGTAKFTSDEEVTDCTWSETGNGFKLEGGAKMTFKEDRDGIKSNILGVDLHFEKQ